MGNALAWTVLGGWPVLVLAAFAARRDRAPLARTTAWAAILGVMLVPPSIRLTLPGFFLNKERITLLSVWIALSVFHREELRAAAGLRRFPRLMMAVLAAGAFMTASTNGDPLAYGPVTIPGLGLRDGLAMAISFFLDAFVPFTVGLVAFGSAAALRDLFDVLGRCALLYLPLCALELRLSPVLCDWLYGYTPGTFLESVRQGGYRPVVFMNHGLSVAMFYFTALTASVALGEAGVQLPWLSARLRAALLGVNLVLCKSLAPVVYALGTLATRVLSSPERRIRVAAAVAALVATFAVTRAEGSFPVTTVVEAFAQLDAERADSLAYRIRNEDALLARASERPLYGWGYWARGFIYSEEGEYLSVTDGLWIIYLSSFGWVGVIGYFSLLLVPVLLLLRARARLASDAQVLASFLSLIVAAFAVDYIPNATSDYLPMAYAGALFAVASDAGDAGAPLERPARP